MRRGLLGWECQGQPVIYGEDSRHHLGLRLFHRHHFVLPIITAFSLLKVVSIAVITIYGQDSWHHLSLCLFHRHHFRHFSACNLCRERLKPPFFFLLSLRVLDLCLLFFWGILLGFLLLLYLFKIDGGRFLGLLGLFFFFSLMTDESCRTWYNAICWICFGKCRLWKR